MKVSSERTGRKGEGEGWFQKGRAKGGSESGVQVGRKTQGDNGREGQRKAFFLALLSLVCFASFFSSFVCQRRNLQQAAVVDKIACMC